MLQQAAGIDWISYAGYASAAGLLLWLLLLLIGKSTRGVPRCRRCGYDMTGASSLACPECGRLHKDEKQLLRRRRSRKWIAIACVLLAVLPVSLTYGPTVQQRMHKGEAFIQAAVPTTVYCLLIPSLGDDALHVLMDRGDWHINIGVSPYSSPYTQPPAGHPPTYYFPGEAEYADYQRKLIIWQCGRVFRDPSASVDRRAQMLEWMIFAAGVPDVDTGRYMNLRYASNSTVAPLPPDWDMLALALEDANPFIRQMAAEYIFECFFDDPFYGHDPAWRRRVGAACVHEFSDTNAAWYPMFPLGLRILEHWGAEARPLAAPMVRLDAELDDKRYEATFNQWYFFQPPIVAKRSPVAAYVACMEAAAAQADER